MSGSLNWKVAGAAGDGILNAGMMFAKACMRAGLHAFATAEYPSLIRGGHNHLDVRVSSLPLHAHTKHVDLLVALNKESVTRHVSKMTNGSGIIFDPDEQQVAAASRPAGVQLYPVPLKKIAMQSGGLIFRNTVAIGASLALTGLPLDHFNSVLRDNFSRKGIAIVDANVLATKAGHDYALEHFPERFAYRLQVQEKRNDILLSGNEAIVAGAVKAGCKFFAAYPMTPASSVLMALAKHDQEFGIVVKQTEDEIAAINMAIGASFAGARSMTATAGGGFALMVEGLGLAAQTETPLVIVEGQRPGPATGMATHTGQGDLRYVLHASTDEFPRVVVAPGDIEQCFHLTFDAFNIADKYQLPVIVITDKFLAESYQSVPSFTTQGLAVDRGKLFVPGTGEYGTQGGFYQRYKITQDGVSTRSVPGQAGGWHVASSYEHDEEGFEREEEETRMAMHHKRFRKLESLRNDPGIDISPKVQGKGDITLVCWGSVKMSVLEAMRLLAKDGIGCRAVQLVYISPFPAKSVQKVLANGQNIMVENNLTGQLAGIILEQTGVEIKRRVLKYDGRPFFPEEVAEGVKALLADPALNEIVCSRGMARKI